MSELTISEACEELNRRKWRGRDDWSSIGGEFTGRPHAAQAGHLHLFAGDAIAIATGLIAQDQLAAAQGRIEELEQQVEVGHQISGSFFEALKPLNLTAIYVTDPGRHVSDLINEVEQLRAERDILQIWNENGQETLEATQQQLAALKTRLR